MGEIKNNPEVEHISAGKGEPFNPDKMITLPRPDFLLKMDSDDWWDSSENELPDMYDDDAQDEESVDARIWDSDVSYDEMSENQQWYTDNGYPYDEAQKEDEFDDGHRIEDWTEYRDAKLNSDNPDDFMSYNEWLEEKEKWEEDHNAEAPYSDAFQDYQNSEQKGDTELAKWREYREEKDNSDDSDSFPSYEDWGKSH